MSGELYVGIFSTLRAFPLNLKNQQVLWVLLGSTMLCLACARL